MTIEFWTERWREGRIGFHEGAPNEYLQAHKSRLGQGRRVLVPLCGKSEDLAYLAAEGHTVVGVEAVEEAVQAFFREHGLTPEVVEIEPSKPIRSYSAEGITILCGDVFACRRADVGRVDALYDRAALVALPEDERLRYVQHLRGMLTADAVALLVTFTYAEGATTGPPFSVEEPEVRYLFGGARSIDLVDSGPVRKGRLHQEGIPATEHCFAIAL